MPERTWTVLIADPHATTRERLTRALELEYHIVTAATGAESWAAMAAHDIDLVVAAADLRDMTGVACLAHLRVVFPEALRVLLTDCNGPDDMAAAVRDAAPYQVVCANWRGYQIALLVRRALESRELSRLHRYLSRELRFADEALRHQKHPMALHVGATQEFDRLVFASDSMAEVCNLARSAAATDLPVLIEGETGTGKELLARAVHQFSPRQHKPFLAQNCAALPDDLLQSQLFGHKRGAFTGAVSDQPGLFAAAEGGTVFLDEIGDVSPLFQVSLLRILQEHEYTPVGSQVTKRSNVRIIAATNRPLHGLVQRGLFRQDLYYRLRGFILTIPPLRERTEDIPVIAEHIVARYAASIDRKIAGIANEVMRRLCLHPFPGNVRELENECKRMVALAADGAYLSAQHMSADFLAPDGADDTLPTLPGLLVGRATLKGKVESLEQHLVLEALTRANWNHSRAARALGLSRVGLANKIKRYHLAAPVTA